MNAIYARQSLEKKDSISIDTQIEYGKTLCDGNYSVYKDSGYSGSNTDRPDFQRLLKDIAAGKIKKVICYRLDRISRSLTDFAKLIEFFESKNVQFISATEQFDTSTPMGRAMVYIVMVFAQLERETIASRIKDNYYARAGKGMYLGGGCAFGYKSVKVNLENKNVSVLEEDIETSELIKEIFNKYAYTSESLYNLTRTIPGTWTTTKISRILKNPVYVENSPDIYQYYKSQGYQINSTVDEFSCHNGCMIVGKEIGRKNRRKTDISEQTLIIGMHKPLIDAKTFLICQHKLSKNKITKRAGTSALSWITGLVRCGECGHALTVKTLGNEIKKYYYLICRGHCDYGKDKCTNNKFFKLEDYEIPLSEKIIQEIEQLDFSMLKDETQPKSDIIKIKSEIIKIDEKIENLLNQMSEGVVGSYITQKIESLDKEKKHLQSQLINNDEDANLSLLIDLKNNIREKWNNADIKERHRLASMITKSIKIYANGETDVVWYY